MALVDDRLLVHAILTGLPSHTPRLATTSYWYFRACRAAMAGAGGQLSGPFLALDRLDQERAVLELLRLPDSIRLPDPRDLVPTMAELALRHPRLNLLNLEALAAGTLAGPVWLSPAAAAGVLPQALDAEGVPWQEVEPW